MIANLDPAMSRKIATSRHHLEHGPACPLFGAGRGQARRADDLRESRFVLSLRAGSRSRATWAGARRSYSSVRRERAHEQPSSREDHLRDVLGSNNLAGDLPPGTERSDRSHIFAAMPTFCTTSATRGLRPPPRKDRRRKRHKCGVFSQQCQVKCFERFAQDGACRARSRPREFRAYVSAIAEMTASLFQIAIKPYADSSSALMS